MLHIFRYWSRGMNHPKRLAGLLLIVTSVVALAACAGEPTATPKPTSATDSLQSTSTPTPTAQATDKSTPTHEPESTSSPEAKSDQIASGPIAPRLTGIVGWVNTEPFTMDSLRGKVVLIDFWTYTCVNCIRTFPFLKEWHDKYAEHGLVIVGVHSPEFEFEKIRDNVVAAAAQRYH